MPVNNNHIAPVSSTGNFAGDALNGLIHTFGQQLNNSTISKTVYERVYTLYNSHYFRGESNDRRVQFEQEIQHLAVNDPKGLEKKLAPLFKDMLRQSRNGASGGATYQEIINFIGSLGFQLEVYLKPDLTNPINFHLLLGLRKPALPPNAPILKLICKGPLIRPSVDGFEYPVFASDETALNRHRNIFSGAVSAIPLPVAVAAVPRAAVSASPHSPAQAAMASARAVVNPAQPLPAVNPLNPANPINPLPVQRSAALPVQPAVAAQPLIPAQPLPLAAAQPVNPNNALPPQANPNPQLSNAPADPIFDADDDLLETPPVSSPLDFISKGIEKVGEMFSGSKGGIAQIFSSIFDFIKNIFKSLTPLFGSLFGNAATTPESNTAETSKDTSKSSVSSDLSNRMNDLMQLFAGFSGQNTSQDMSSSQSMTPDFAKTMAALMSNLSNGNTPTRPNSSSNPRQR